MNLTSKYNVAAPRYTSYPTVPAWSRTPDQEQWKDLVRTGFKKTNSSSGISLYIHLPYCESLCTYCACNTRITVNHKVEEPYIETLLKEWQLYLALFDEKPRLKEIHLGGGTPTFFSPDNLHKLLSGIFSGSEICEQHDFSFEGHPSNTTAEHLQTLYNLGFRRVSFGIQDFDPHVQDVINRYQSVEEVEQVVSSARRIGYTGINFDLVYGLPFQTLASISDTLEKVIALHPDRIAFYSYAHVPWIKPGQRKFTEKDLPLDVEKRALYEKGLELFKEAGYEDVGMDHFALRTDALFEALRSKKLHRNFMGYTDKYTALMISLGASAISDTWSSFAQNIKVVEPYREAVEQGKFPIFKGHILNEEDLILRKHILNIMCKDGTNWEGDQQKSKAIQEGLVRCEELEKDDLIKTDHTGLSVTHKGRAFLRNICLCFDAHYWSRAEKQSMFSSTV